jgi:hypothetical protein
MTDSTESGTQGSDDSAQAEAPVTSDTDPTQTQHPAGDSQAQENQETESPA